MIGGNVIMYLLFTFIIYSFAGWIIEELYSKYSTGRFKKDGFLEEPLKTYVWNSYYHINNIL